MDLLARLQATFDPGTPLADKLLPLLARPAGVSSSGHPYLQQASWEHLRDRVPHLFRMGQRVVELVELVEAALDGDKSAQADNARNVCRVVRQIVFTAAITAPTDLWLLRHLLQTFGRLGLLDRLLAGGAIYPESCHVAVDGETRELRADELDTDLHFLLSRGIVEQYERSYRIAGHPRVAELLRSVDAEPELPEPTPLWTRLFKDDALSSAEQEALLNLAFPLRSRTDCTQNHWIPTAAEVELGYRLVPVVLGLRAANKTAALSKGSEWTPGQLCESHPLCAAAALEILTAAGWTRRDGERYEVTALGARGFARGPGPFGIIQTYHPYMTQGTDILLKGRGSVWVQRTANVFASQDANRRTFERANDALDRFCADTGFSLTVFIEHAMGRGEATRQRFERSGGDTVRYVGADLEDAAIDAAIEEQKRGHLPRDMIFVRNADIGAPDALLQPLREQGIAIDGAVMMVGNGFHEVRNQTDQLMVDVFRGYADAGIILLFTEENALSIDDLRATAWNTYHAGFSYVHEKSGQGLRPAEPREHVRLGRPLRASWSDCARQAGYVRADDYCTRTRTIYPYTPPSGLNPSISTNHFWVPARLASKLGL